MCFDVSKTVTQQMRDDNQRELKMTDAQRSILSTLQRNTNPTTGTGLRAYELQNLVGQPQPSIRRNIGALRNYGYRIEVTPWKGYIYYPAANPTISRRAIATSGARF